MLSADLTLIVPEIMLAVYAMVALLVAVYTTKDAIASLLVWITAGLMITLGAWITVHGEGTNVAFGGMIVEDAFARFAKVAILLSAAAILVMSEGYMQARGLLRFEYPMLVALSAVGMMIMSASVVSACRAPRASAGSTP